MITVTVPAQKVLIDYINEFVNPLAGKETVVNYALQLKIPIREIHLLISASLNIDRKLI